MPTYQLKPVGGSDLAPGNRCTIQASNDLEALMIANGASNCLMVEVWDELRLVGVIAGKAPSANDLAQIAGSFQEAEFKDD